MQLSRNTTENCLPKYRNAKESVNPSPETKRSSLTQEEFFASSTSGVSGGKMDGCCFLNFGSWYKDTFKDVSIRVSWCQMSLFLINGQWSPPGYWLIYPCPSDFSCFHFLHFFHASDFGAEKRHFCISLWIYPCPSVRNVHMKLQFDWIGSYWLAGPRVSTAILVNLFDFHSRAQCQKWWQNCLRTFPWKLKFSVNLSHIQSSGNFQRNPRVMMGIAMK